MKVETMIFVYYNLMSLINTPIINSSQTCGSLYVVSDIHGYLDEFVNELIIAKLIDVDKHWIGGNTQLWILGDLIDRGPDGIGVIDLIRKLEKEAELVGGKCQVILGNHEILLIGVYYFVDDLIIASDGSITSFYDNWLINGGQDNDLIGLMPEHIEWLSNQPIITQKNDYLLVHSDTLSYLSYGTTIDEINEKIRSILLEKNKLSIWNLWISLTNRYAFRDALPNNQGIQNLSKMFQQFGGKILVHGHSPVPFLIEGDNLSGTLPPITEPLIYANNQAIGIDGGISLKEKILIVELKYLFQFYY